MATGDLLGKRLGAFGIGRQTAALTERAAPAHWLNCDSANIEFTPNVYERVNNIGANKIGIQQAGSDYKFSFSNAELSVDEVGYLLWLFMGGSVATDTVPTPDKYTITNQFDSEYFSVFKNHGGPFNSAGNNWERLVGCRFDSLTIEQGRAGYAKVSGSGVGLELNPLTNAATPSVSLGDDDAPLSWAALQDGDFQLAWGAGSLTTVTAPTSVKLDFSREVSAQGASLAGNDYTEVVEGGRSLSFTIEMDFEEGDTDVEEAIAAAKAGTDVKLALTWLTGVNKLVFLSSPSRITASPAGEIGTGTEAQMVTIEAEAFDTGSDIFSIEVHSDTVAFS